MNIRGSKVKITPAINDYIENKIGKLDKYLEDPRNVTANVVVKVKGKDQTVEVTIPMKKLILRAEDTHNDLYAAIDLVSEKLERQIRKNKTRMKKKVSKELIDFKVDFKIEKDEDEKGRIVKRKIVETKPMNEEEAILQMNLFHCNGFCQIPRLIHIQSLCHADIVSHQLQRHNSQTGCKVLLCLRHVNGKIRIILYAVISVEGKTHQISAAALNLHHIAEGFLEQRFLCYYADNQRPVLNQTDGAVL